MKLAYASALLCAASCAEEIFDLEAAVQKNLMWIRPPQWETMPDDMGEFLKQSPKDFQKKERPTQPDDKPLEEPAEKSMTISNLDSPYYVKEFVPDYIFNFQTQQFGEYEEPAHFHEYEADEYYDDYEDSRYMHPRHYDRYYEDERRYTPYYSDSYHEKPYHRRRFDEDQYRRHRDRQDDEEQYLPRKKASRRAHMREVDEGEEIGFRIGTAEPYYTPVFRTKHRQEPHPHHDDSDSEWSAEEERLYMDRRRGKPRDIYETQRYKPTRRSEELARRRKPAYLRDPSPYWSEDEEQETHLPAEPRFEAERDHYETSPEEGATEDPEPRKERDEQYFETDFDEGASEHPPAEHPLAQPKQSTPTMTKAPLSKQDTPIKAKAAVPKQDPLKQTARKAMTGKNYFDEDFSDSDYDDEGFNDHYYDHGDKRSRYHDRVRREHYQEDFYTRPYPKPRSGRYWHLLEQAESVAQIDSNFNLETTDVNPQNFATEMPQPVKGAWYQMLEALEAEEATRRNESAEKDSFLQ